jgi:phosphoglycerol transferase MdoB-like AlkP superfamily enzyme
MADHYPYKLDMKTINSLSSYERDSVVEVNHNNLIIWNSQMEDIHIEKTCMSSDVLPTIYNLFGVEYDSRLFTGTDILSPSSGIAVFSNRSWKTDNGTYFASGTKYVGEEPSEDYVTNINNIVKNRLSIAKLIIKSDYYKYLLK